MNVPDKEPLFAWQEIGEDGRWGIIATVVPFISAAPVPLVHRDQALVEEKLRPLAEAHARASGNVVRLHRFDSTHAFLCEITP